MSWISGLAGKAENFLNNLDNSAAQALNKSQDHIDHTSYVRKIEPVTIKEYDRISQENNESMSTKSLPLKLSGSKSVNSSLNKEDDLFQFSLKNNSKSLTKSRSDIFSNPKVTETMSDKGSSGYRTNYDDGSDKCDERIDFDHVSEANANIENKLLRSEISSLNQEISSLLQRNHKSEEETKRLRNQLEKVSSQLREVDRKFRDIVSSKDDLQEMLKVKDNQILVLQSELNSKKDFIGETNILTDHRNKIIMLDEELRNKNDIIEKLESDVVNLQMAADDAKIKLAQTTNNYERIRSDDRRRVDMLSSQLNVSKQKTENIQKELKDYKNKATKILQMKEKVIASLKGETEGIEDQLSPSGNSEEIFQQNLNLRLENDQLREEVSRLRVELENKDFDLQEQDQQMHTETESLRNNLDLLEEQLERERQLREDTDTDFRQLTRENRHLQEKYMREKAEFHDHLASKDEELARMRQMLSTKQGNQTDEVVELDARVRSLTETLIHKQASLDASKAANHSLQIRLERAESDLSVVRQAASVPGFHSERRGAPPASSDLVAIHVRDAPVTRHLKTALNTADRVTVKAGLLLRRYPPARLCFLLYTAVLHLWVLFVLLTYQPEMHPGNPGPPSGQS